MPKMTDKLGEGGVEKLAHVDLDGAYEDLLDPDETTGIWLVADMLHHEMCGASLGEEQISMLEYLGYTREQLSNAEVWLSRKLCDALVELRDGLAQGFRD